MTAATISPNELSTDTTSTFNAAFSKAATFLKDTTVATASLTYDFVKSNALLIGVAADLTLNGGGYSKQLLVSGVETVAGAIGELGSNAASGLWDYVNIFD